MDPDNGEASLETTVWILNEGKSLLATHQKHIRIADRVEMNLAGREEEREGMKGRTVGT